MSQTSHKIDRERQSPSLARVRTSKRKQNRKTTKRTPRQSIKRMILSLYISTAGFAPAMPSSRCPAPNYLANRGRLVSRHRGFLQAPFQGKTRTRYPLHRYSPAYHMPNSRRPVSPRHLQPRTGGQASTLHWRDIETWFVRCTAECEEHVKHQQAVVAKSTCFR